MATKISVAAAQVSVHTIPMSKSVLKQMDRVEQFTRDFLPGGKDAQHEDYTIVGWVHGSVMEAGEDYWCWLVIMLEMGEYRRMRVSRDDLKRWSEKHEWMKGVKQLYL